MAMYIPEGYCNVTQVAQCVGVTKEITWSIGFYFRNDDSGPFTTDEEFMGIEGLAASGSYLDADEYSSEWMIVRTQYDFGTGGTPVSYVRTKNRPGTTSHTCPPVNSAVLVKKQGSSSSRSKQGRMYLPAMFMGEGVITPAGVMDAGQVAIIQDNLEGYLASMAAGDAFPCVFHSGSTAPSEVVGLQVSGTLATQRRRMR